MASKIMSAERLEEQANYIDQYISKSKMFNKYENITINGISNSQIVRAINGELKNIHNSVFKSCLGRNKCEECNKTCSLDRAHTVGRLQIAENVLNKIHPDLTKPFNLKEFYIAYVAEHKLYGVWMLCKECHIKLG
jgi:hypothetical protein